MVARTTGERYDVRHRPVVDEGRLTGSYGRCTFVLPSGAVCDRQCNWVDDGGTTGPNYEATGHWRHNPRPYSNH